MRGEAPVAPVAPRPLLSGVFDLPLPVRLTTVAVFGYAVGCLNAAYYVVRRRLGSDIRDHHSGNAGATNAGRVMGRRGYLAVLVLDTGKGAAAALVGLALAGATGAAVGGVASVVGHVWPAQLGWRGGMGVATMLGVMLLVDPLVLLAGIAIASACYGVTRRYMASGLVAMATAPFVGALLGRPWTTIVPLTVMVAIMAFTHRGDMREAFAPRTGA